MTQRSLFNESLNDAIRELVRSLGGTKKVGALMRPEKSVDEAGRWLSDCLNPDRREHLDPEHVLWLIKQGRAIGCHALIDYLCDEGGYQQPDPIEPQDEIAELQRQYVEAAKGLQKMAERIERLATIVPLKAAGGGR